MEKEDGDEDAGYQGGWHLDLAEQPKSFSTWDRRDIDLDEGDRMEKWIVVFAAGSGLRRGESWCLHLTDVHVADNEEKPRVEVRFGSWDPVKKRCRAPKGRKGEKKNRTVYLHGIALEAARAWLSLLPIYAPKNPLGLMFPTERGARRTGVSRSWKKVVTAFVRLVGHAVEPGGRVEGPRSHGRADVRTTQIYAHLEPSVLHATVLRAQAAYAGSPHDAVTAQRPSARKEPQTAGFLGHAR